MSVRTCVAPSGQFVYGVHEPHFRVPNLRQNDHIGLLGEFRDGRPVHNHTNFPAGEIDEKGAELIFEIPNPFPFRGTTYILKGWADAKARDPAAIKLPEPQPWSFSDLLRQWSGGAAAAFPFNRLDRIFSTLPEPLQLALAATSTDPEDLMRLAEQCCDFVHDPATGRPVGLVYAADGDAPPQAVIRNTLVFEALANNIHLPDDYKRAMALRPGVQGDSEIVGDVADMAAGTHVFEYLRRNSYIPWGHYAANMADDAVRYRIEDLTAADVTGMRHLYYQRTYTRLADRWAFLCRGAPGPFVTSPGRLALRIIRRLGSGTAPSSLPFNATLWGWNFGFDFSPSAYRLNASHQQIHQQYAMVPAAVTAGDRLKKRTCRTTSRRLPAATWWPGLRSSTGGKPAGPFSMPTSRPSTPTVESMAEKTGMAGCRSIRTTTSCCSYPRPRPPSGRSRSSA